MRNGTSAIGRFALAVAAGTSLFGTAARAQSFAPPLLERTIGIGESFTFSSAITLGTTGATTVDLFFLADNTGSMGSIINNARNGAGAILGALPNTYQFGVGRYVGDPVEGVSPNQSYVQNTPLTHDKAAAQAGINTWTASGGGDTPEANFFALRQVASTAAWRPEAQRLVVWFGDAPSHTATTTQAQAIAALRGVDAKVVAFNSSGAGAGIDASGQASAVVAGAGGALVNNFLGLSPQAFISTVLGQIGAATTTVDLMFGSTLVGSGLTLGFSCTDPLGCNGVRAGETRSFDMTITGVTPGEYEFNVFARGVDAVQANRITVAAVPEPSTLALLAAGVLAAGGVARRRRHLFRD